MLLPLLLLAAAPVDAVPPKEQAKHQSQASIPFADHQGLRNWTLGKDDSTLYVQDRRSQWYKVSLAGTCFTFRTPMVSLGYTTSAGGSFDQFSTVFDPSQPGNRCNVLSVYKSTPPPGTTPPHNASKQVKK